MTCFEDLVELETATKKAPRLYQSRGFGRCCVQQRVYNPIPAPRHSGLKKYQNRLHQMLMQPIMHSADAVRKRANRPRQNGLCASRAAKECDFVRNYAATQQVDVSVRPLASPWCYAPLEMSPVSDH